MARLDFSADQTLRSRLFDLLDQVFPGAARLEARSRALGAAWEGVSTPFVHAERDRILAHVGVMEMTFVLDDRETAVGVIHGVATHPERRRQGLFRGLMEEALEWCEGRWPALILCTERPEYYGAFGFRIVPEHRFLGRVRADLPPGLRRLNLDEPGDLATVHRLLETRVPVSRVLGVVREKAAFFFNESFRPLHYAPSIDAVLCFEAGAGRLSLFDVVAPRDGALRELLAGRSGDAQVLEVGFSPDRLAIAGLGQEPWRPEGTVLMVRGPFAPEGRALTLPRPARC